MFGESYLFFSTDILLARHFILVYFHKYIARVVKGYSKNLNLSSI